MSFESKIPQNIPLEQKPKDPVNSKSTPEMMQDLMSKVIEEAEKIEIKENDRNEKGELLVSPDGAVSNLGQQNELWWKIARTESFKKWFGDWQISPENSSKILDKNGEPIVVFRGAGKDLSIDEFYNKEFYYSEKREAHAILGRGVYVTPEKNRASGYGNLFPVFINSRKPKYKETTLDKLGLDEFLNDVVLFVPKKIFKKIPEISLSGYDSVFGYVTSDNKSSTEKLPDIEDLEQFLVKNPNQILIVPNPTQKDYKSAKEYKQE